MQAAAASTAYFSGLLLALACSSDVSLGRGDGLARSGAGGTSARGTGGEISGRKNCGGEAALGGYVEAGVAIWDGSAGNPYGYPPGYVPAAECATVGFHDTCDFWELCALPCDDASDCPLVDGAAPPDCRSTSASAGTCVLPCAGEQACPEGMQCVLHPYGYGEICMWRVLSPLAEADFLDALAAAMCDGLEPCCSATGLGYDRARCAEHVAAAIRDLAPEHARSRFRYDATAAAECVELSRQSTARCEQGLGDACQRVYAGTTAPGAACSVFRECAVPEGGGARCELTSFEQGTCVEQPRGRAGDACGWTCSAAGCSSEGDAGRARCYVEDGLYCARGTCRAQAPEGASCDEDEACSGGARCAEGRCAPRARLDAACSSSGECELSLYCEEALGTCQPRKAAGAICDPAVQDECSDSCEGTVCVASWPSAELCGAS